MEAQTAREKICVISRTLNVLSMGGQRSDGISFQQEKKKRQ